MSYAAIIRRAEPLVPLVKDESERGACRYILRELARFDAGTRDEGPEIIEKRLREILRRVTPDQSGTD